MSLAAKVDEAIAAMSTATRGDEVCAGIAELGDKLVAEIKRRSAAEVQVLKLESTVAEMQAQINKVERDSKRRVEELEDRLDDRRNVRPRTDGVDHQGLAERYRMIIHLASLSAQRGDMDAVRESLDCVNE